MTQDLRCGLTIVISQVFFVARSSVARIDHQVRVEFAGFLRPQIKFDSAQDLVDELKRNVEETKRITA